MKVSHLVFRFPNLSETFVLNQVMGLHNAGVDLYIFSALKPTENDRNLLTIPDLPKSKLYYYPDSPKNFFDRLRGLPSYYKSLGNARKRSLLRSINPLRFGSFGASLSLAETFRAYPEFLSFDIIHCQFLTIAPTALDLFDCGVLQGRLVAAVRGFDLSDMERNQQDRLQKIFDRFELLLPVSHALANRLLDLGCPQKKVRVHHSGIAIDDFHVARSNIPGNRILSVGRLVEKKGIDDLIDAVAILRDRGLYVELDVIGDGELRDELNNRIKKNRIQDRTHLLGPKTHSEVKQALTRASLFVLPSRTGRNGDTEGIPNSLKEAMAAGLLVVSTKHGGIPDLIEDGISGFLVPERSPEELASAIETVLSLSPIKREAISRAATLKIQQDFDIKRLSHELISLYEKISNL